MLKEVYRIKTLYGSVIILPNIKTTEYIGSIMPEGLVFESVMADEPFQFPLALRYSNEHAHFIEVAEKIAHRMLKAISLIPSHHEKIIRFCLHGGVQAVELLEECPVIVFLATQKLDRICDSVSYQKAVDLLIGQKHHEILQQCSFPSSVLNARLLRKVPPRFCYPAFFSELETVFFRNDKQQIEILDRLESITTYIVDIMNADFIAPYARPEFYEAICDLPEVIYPRFKFEIGLIEEVHRHIPAHPHLCFIFFSLEDFDNAVDICTHIMKSYVRLEHSTFPAPPIPAHHFSQQDLHFGIFPISSTEALMNEDIMMRNSISEYYWGKIEESEIDEADFYYVYHVSLPGYAMASVLIEKEETGWKIAGIRGVNGSEVSTETRRHVFNWLTDWNRKQ
jgi:hypothetical protein